MEISKMVLPKKLHKILDRIEQLQNYKQVKEISLAKSDFDAIKKHYPKAISMEYAGAKLKIL